MRKSTRDAIHRLEKLIGLPVLRTKPTVNGDRSYTHGNPIVLLGFTPDGRIKYRHTGIEANIFGNKEYILPNDFTDRNWISYKKALKPKRNPINEWVGKKIIRTCPVPLPSNLVDRSYMDEAVTLVSASKHHMVILDARGNKNILGYSYSNPKDWALVE